MATETGAAVPDSVTLVIDRAFRLAREADDACDDGVTSGRLREALGLFWQAYFELPKQYRAKPDGIVVDLYYYAREHDGSGWSVRGPNGFCLKKADGPMDKNVAYVIAKLLSDDPGPALELLRNSVQQAGQ